MPVNINGYNKIKEQLQPFAATLIAVSKTKPAEDILAMYELGQRDFAENYVQELTGKYESLPKDIHWHFIGHLQTNKVKYIASFVHLIHGVDSEKLLIEINKQAAKVNRTIPCLLQVYISKDETKFGFDEKELEAVLQKISNNPSLFSSIKITGLMGMATFTEDNALIESEFAHLKKIFDQVKIKYRNSSIELTEISMGMSADYMFALPQGATMIRIGSLLFGERNYKPS